MRVVKHKQNKTISRLLANGISFGLFVFFFYPLLHGDRGYFAWKGVEQRLADSQARYQQVRDERAALENRVKMLRPDSLDLDLLDERARAVLGFLKPSEVVVLDKSS